MRGLSAQGPLRALRETAAAAPLAPMKVQVNRGTEQGVAPLWNKPREAGGDRSAG